ncbi:unnamed protein product [Echinostoma caproni]|uniref:Secreted protein n=1 Tax=Echinostoma caproni TaxID=27848 RepID=A0A183AR59_9TREM|nr:unnamed protein product [Echinostoma caproni]
MWKQYKSQQLPANNNPEKMKSNIVKILLITVCVSVVVAQNKQSCKEVVASDEVQQVTVLVSGTGCQYLVKSDSGKAVKVYVNATSGTKCVKVSSDGKSDTLCPSGATNQISSSSPIEVSADSDTTSPEETTTPTEAATESTTTPTGPTDPKSPGESGKEDPLQDPQGPASGKEGQNSGSGTEKIEEAAPLPGLLRKARANSETNASNDVIVYYVLGEN